MSKWILWCTTLACVAANAQQAPLTKRTINVFTTAQNAKGRIIKTSSGKAFSPMEQPKETQVCVFVDPSKTFQTFVGIGGAITDASAETFAKLSKDKQQELLAAYYDLNNGIGYSLARTNMNSCDFSSDMYTYVKDNDPSLKSFDITHDKQFKIPMIKQAMAAAGVN